MVNKYRTQCNECHREVPPGQGDVIKRYGRWVGYCAEHAPVGSVHDCYSPTTGNRWTVCGCEDYPCCGH